jgi:hypothetical protein
MKPGFRDTNYVEFTATEQIRQFLFMLRALKREKDSTWAPATLKPVKEVDRSVDVGNGQSASLLMYIAGGLNASTMGLGGWRLSVLRSVDLMTSIGAEVIRITEAFVATLRRRMP